ncbi:hypothetical protein LSH36_2166g00007 [Paralvinella palmiformis]|uniref:Hcy-binding domain-containing protein n=1 Tax=Paralvinella palmiformis TaxID=53620 RepID=A0AAD9IRL3_9ANNE|nr:hypothetical protein LSH36_2166g00007 [Paralvinella palmiformis]
MTDQQHYLVVDGGNSTELISTYGKEHLNEDPLWSARLLFDEPTLLNQVHMSFLDAGADIIKTSSYQASIEGFVEHLSLSPVEAHDLIVKNRPRPLVAGSIGPYGAYQHDGSEYTGNYVDNMTVEELALWHQSQVKPLVESDVDLLAFETIPAQKEAEAIIMVLREYPNVKAWISFSCKDSKSISHGESIKEATDLVMSSPNVIAVGMNCLPPENVLSLLQLIPDPVKAVKSIIVCPNSGEIWSDDKWLGKKCNVPLHSYVPQWQKAGAAWIGGCCRVSPKDISQIKEMLYKCIN